MPRKIPVECAGAVYHVMSRGDPSEDIFLDDVSAGAVFDGALSRVFEGRGYGRLRKAA
jgi:hypothetical protein